MSPHWAVVTMRAPVFSDLFSYPSPQVQMVPGPQQSLNQILRYKKLKGGSWYVAVIREMDPYVLIQKIAERDVFTA